MGRPPEHSRAEALAAATHCFWTRGYEATSLADLLEATGVSKSTLYAEFGSKKELFNESVDQYMDSFGFMLAPLRHPEDGLSAIRAFLRNYRQQMSDPDAARQGCMMVNATVELAAEDPQVAALSQQYQGRLIDLVSACLQTAEHEGQVTAGDSRGRARIFTATLMGVFVAARSANTSSELEPWLESVENLVDSWT